MDKVELVSRAGLERQLAEQLRRGRLPDLFLYLGAGGVANWLRLAASADYGLSGRLEELLRQAASELAEEIPPCCDVVSIGVGAGRKERLILEALMDLGGRPRYFPVDVSTEMVDVARAAVADLGPEGCGLVAPIEALPRLAHRFRPPVLLCLLGNNASNFEPGWLLPMLRNQLGPQDRLLLDFHLVPENRKAAAAEITRRYGCELNRAFNLGPLIERGLAPTACELSLEVFPCQGLPGFRTRKRLRLKRCASVRCAGEVVHLAAGTSLELGFTYKYTPSGVEELVARHGLSVLWSHGSPEGAFRLLLLGVAMSQEQAEAP